MRFLLSFCTIIFSWQLLTASTCCLYCNSPDSIRHLEVSFEGHTILVRLPYNQGKQHFSPCTYLLQNGSVVYGECGGLYHTPNKGKELLRIQCYEPGKLYYERFGDAVAYSPAPFMSAISLEARPIPYKIEYYDASYSQLISVFDLRADNPYTKEKIPRIEIEQHYDGEMGFGYPSPGDETAWLWTYSGVFFFDNGYTGITYRLFRQNANRALLGISTTISILNAHGELIYKMPDMDADIAPVLITKDGKYLATQLNILSDYQNYPRRLGNPGIRVSDMQTGEVVFEYYVKSMFDNIGTPSEYRDGLIRYRIKEAHLDDEVDGLQVILDMRERKKYERLFSIEEWKSISQKPEMLYSKQRGLLDVYEFTSTKF